MNTAKNQHADHKYILALLDNDSMLIHEIYEKYSDQISTLVTRNSGSVDDAKDVFQEGLMTIARQFRNIEKKLTCPFGAYLYMVCRSHWLNTLTKRKHSQVTIENYNGLMHEEACDLAEETINSDLKNKLFKEKFEELGARCQELIKLSWTGLSMKEVAAKMDITYAYVRKKKSECTAHLMKLVQQSPIFEKIKSRE